MDKKESAAEKVVKYLETRPYIKLALKNNIINYTLLSKKICLELGINATENKLAAVNVAIRRYKRSLRQDKSSDSNISDILQNSTLEINTGVNVYISKKKIDLDLSSRFHSINSNDFNVLITKDEVEGNYLEKHSNLVEIQIKSPQNIESEPGLILKILEKLFEYSINVVEMYSCYTNTIILVEKVDFIKSINALNQLGVS